MDFADAFKKFQKNHTSKECSELGGLPSVSNKSCSTVVSSGVLEHLESKIKTAITSRKNRSKPKLKSGTKMNEEFENQARTANLIHGKLVEPILKQYDDLLAQHADSLMWSHFGAMDITSNVMITAIYDSHQMKALNNHEQALSFVDTMLGIIRLKLVEGIDSIFSGNSDKN